MRRYVVDTSVIVKWFSSGNEEDTDKSLQLRQAYIDNSIELVAPDYSTMNWQMLYATIPLSIQKMWMHP